MYLKAMAAADCDAGTDNPCTTNDNNGPIDSGCAAIQSEYLIDKIQNDRWKGAGMILPCPPCHLPIIIVDV